MVIENVGQQAWEDIEGLVGATPDQMISSRVYDDDTTVRILAAAADYLGLSLPDCLENFGKYWITFAERGSYGSIMDFTGRDLETFVSNLDRMHQAVIAAMPEARVPSFKVTGSREGWMQVEYRSDRAGLEAFVTGLFKGLLDRFGLEGAVSQPDSRSNAVVYEVTYSVRSPGP